MEENNDIFLTGGNALVHLAKPKNIPQNLFGATHLVRTYLLIYFSTPISLYAVWMTISPVTFLQLPPFPQLRTE